MDGDFGVVHIIDRVAVVVGGAGLVAGLVGAAVGHPAQLGGAFFDRQAAGVRNYMVLKRLGVEHQMVVGEQVGIKLARVACALRLIIPVLIEEGSALTCMRILGAHDVVNCATD